MDTHGIIQVDPDDPASTAPAVDAFARGRLVAMPTETVYGLAAPIDQPALVEKIFRLKGRPPSNPLIVHVADRDQARACVSSWPPMAERLTRCFWPGPLTLVLPRAAHIADQITAGQDTVALRMPDHPVALAFLRALGRPVVAPSANLFTRLSPTRPEDVASVFPADQVLVLDGGPCRVGIESTIVALDVDGQTVWWLRPGGIDRNQLMAELAPGWRLADQASDADESAPSAPGRMQIHYQPAKPLRVRVTADPADRDRVAQALAQQGDVTVVVLPEDPNRAGCELYASLRAADRGVAGEIELLILQEWLRSPAWEGVLNRLAKAASEWLGPLPGQAL